jgi:hypothetical protein
MKEENEGRRRIVSQREQTTEENDTHWIPAFSQGGARYTDSLVITQS